jgi:hypothetical protein
MVGHPLFRLPLAVGVAIVVAGCSSSSKVLVPPRMDLTRYGTIGMISFSSRDDQDLGNLASRQFVAAIQAAQPGTPILELGDASRVLGEALPETLDPETVRAIGQKYRVDVLVVGVLGAQEVKPKVAIGGSVPSVSASAELEGVLNARMLDGRSGATVWSAAARAKEPLAHVSLSAGGLSGLGGNVRGDAREHLVDGLVKQATRDFWSHWERE